MANVLLKKVEGGYSVDVETETVTTATESFTFGSLDEAVAKVKELEVSEQPAA